MVTIIMSSNNNNNSDSVDIGNMCLAQNIISEENKKKE